MATVEAIKDKKTISAIKNYFREKNMRDYALFTLGINSGLRVGDLLNLSFSDVVKEKKGKVIVLKDGIQIFEQKTGKFKKFPLSKKTSQALKDYIKTVEHFEMNEPLFFSKKRGKDGERKAITRQHAHYLFKDANDFLELNAQIGTHSMRKTFGYHAYKAGAGVGLLMDIFNHSTERMTLRYIGITQDEKDDIYLNIEL